MAHAKSPHDYEQSFWDLARFLAKTKKNEFTLEHPSPRNFKHRWYAFLRALQKSGIIEYEILRDQAYAFTIAASSTNPEFIMSRKATKLEALDSDLTKLMQAEGIDVTPDLSFDLPGDLDVKLPGLSNNDSGNLEDDLEKLLNPQRDK